MPDISKAVRFMVMIAEDDSHGYDQEHRNGPDYDCSSLVGTALHEGGFNVSPYSWTGNLESQLRACGFVDCIAPWKPGDVHLSTLRHVCMSINAKEIAQASINEKGLVTGGKTGDQTGLEINIRNYYEYSNGWDVHLRYVGDNAFDPTNISAEEIAKQVINGRWGNGDVRKKRLESAGYDYNEVQSIVNSILSGEKKKDNYQIAREVIQGKWGNGNDRINKLKNAGYDPSTVQSIVNELMR